MPRTLTIKWRYVSQESFESYGTDNYCRQNIRQFENVLVISLRETRSESDTDLEEKALEREFHERVDIVIKELAQMAQFMVNSNRVKSFQEPYVLPLRETVSTMKPETDEIQPEDPNQDQPPSSRT